MGCFLDNLQSQIAVIYSGLLQQGIRAVALPPAEAPKPNSASNLEHPCATGQNSLNLLV
jgi:hypothetical protein